ncbi:hypothetical protein KR038_000761, partial [Drosophila bunnanda]
MPNKMIESSMEHCEDYKNISKWFDLQDATANSLQRHYDHLEEVLEYLNGTTTSTNCCFYDKDLMQSVMDNFNKIDMETNGINGGKTLSSSGDIRNDLNKIIPRIKKMVTKGYENCCSKMEESLKSMKKDFDEQLWRVKQKFKSEASAEFSKDRKELEEKHQSLEDKIKDTKERLNNLENNKMRSGYQTSCCAELNASTKALEMQIEAMRTETMNKTNQFESQLKDIENMAHALKNRTKGAKNTVETQGEVVERELENCENEFEILTKIQNNNHICCEPCLDKLVIRLKELEERAKLISKNGNNTEIQSCLENDLRMVKIRELADKTKILKSGNSSIIQIISALANEKLKDPINDLEQEVHDLQQASNESQICCENIGKLNTFAEQLENKIEEMQKIYPDILKENNLECENLKKQFSEVQAKLDNIKNKDEQQKLKSLQDMLQTIKSELEVQDRDVHELLNQKQKDYLIGDFEKLNHQFWLEVNDRLSQGQHNGLEPMDRLIKQHKDLNQSLEEAKISLEGLQQQETQYHNEVEKLNQLENQVTKCLNACKEVPKMHDLIRKVNEIVQNVR